ncbi:PAS domain-containing hybrid sensor histidine kinase/response regulator [Magnetococcus sp. PR-3]|uniref:PAS domain-containing hybrid sensor histidine kinase/response regulator n=1 Tax=Magnetococcus sp. PR-3 TaxID=3120355 RepID=UPI002FCE1A61
MAHTSHSTDAPFRTLVESSSQAICVHVMLKPIYVNHAFVQLFGFASVEAVLAMDSIEPYISSEDRPRLNGYLAARMRGDDAPTDYDFRARHQDGSTLFLRNHAFRLMWDDADAVAFMLSDETHRRYAEQAMQASERKLREVLDNAPIGYWLIHPTQRFTMDTNLALNEMLGYSADEMLGKTPMDFVDEENAQIFREQTAQITTRKHRSYAISLRCKNGQQVPCHFHATTLNNTHGEAVASFAFIIDQTQHVQREAKLKQSENRFRAMFEQSPLPMVIAQSYGRLSTGNLAWESLWGISVNELDEMAYNVLSDKELVKHGHQALLARAFEGEVVSLPAICYDPNTESQGRAGRKEPIWVRVFAYPIVDEFKNVLEVILIQEDMTEQKHNEQALAQFHQQIEQTNAKLESLLQAIPDMVFFKDPQGRIIYVNRAYEEALDLKRETILGLKDDQILEPQWAQSSLESDLQALACKEPVRLRQTYTTQGGQTHFVETTKVAIRDEHSHPVGLVGIVHDVTQSQKTLMALEEARKKAESASRAKTDFLAIMSHEIRTPMNAIMGMAELLRDGGVEPQEREHYVVILKRNADGLLAIIDDILNISKVEAGRIELEKIPFDLEDLVENVVATMRTLVREKGLTLNWQVTHGLNTHRLGDPTRLRQVLINLMGNAVKFTEYGSIDLHISEVVPHTIEVTITDTGVGIEPDKLAHIFEPFTQADDAVTRKHGGTGLGLALCRSLVELMQGEITVTSTPMQGSCFRFTIELPSTKIDTPTTPAPQDMPKLTQQQLRNRFNEPARILVVEDSEDNIALLRAFLKNSGVLLEIANHGGEAIAQVCDREGPPFDLIFMDVQMPFMDGYTATRAIRAWEQETQHTPTPIVALTAHALKEDEAKSLAAGCTAHLTKPIRKQVLLETIQCYLLQKQ